MSPSQWKGAVMAMPPRRFWVRRAPMPGEAPDPAVVAPLGVARGAGQAVARGQVEDGVAAVEAADRPPA